MKRRFSSEQKAMMVARYREGELVKTIAADFNCSTGTVTGIVHRGGVPKRVNRGSGNSIPQKVRQWRYRCRSEAKRYVDAWLAQ